MHQLPLVNDGEQLSMAYMDVAPAQPNGRTVVLLHGRNFPSSYWAPVIRMLNDAGYRVVVPDQIGFGKSSKPAGELHFDTLARNTIALLDHLEINKADIVAHSLGGMLGVRIARAYPDRVAHLVLTAPIGLEDYRLYVPPTPTEAIIATEDKLTADGYRKQLQTNYAIKLPLMRSRRISTPASTSRAAPTTRAGCAPSSVPGRWSIASRSRMRFLSSPNLRCSSWAPTTTTHRRLNAPEALRAKMGQNAELAKALAAKMPNARAEVIPNTGHLVFWRRPRSSRSWCLVFSAASDTCVSSQAQCGERSCRIQVMIGRFGSRRVDVLQDLTCRIVSFDSLCATSATSKGLLQGREGRSHEIPVSRRHARQRGRRFQRGRQRRRGLRPRVLSRSLWTLPPDARRGRRCARPPCM